jgi:transposase
LPYFSGVEEASHIHITPQEAHLIKEENKSLKTEVNNLTADNLYLKNELEKLKQLIFGSKSERFISKSDVRQLSLNLLPEQEEQPEEKTETLTYQRKKQTKPESKKKSIRAAPSHLPRREEVIEPEADVSGAKKIGELVTEVLEYEPGNIYVKKIVRPKYAKEDSIIVGELPSLPIPKGNAGPGLLSHIYVSKFVDHLPYNRQIIQFRRQGVELSDRTINGWFNKGCDLLVPLYDKLKELLLENDYMMGDETPISVQDSHKKGSTHRGYHWVYYSPVIKLVCFDYREGRGREGPLSFLETFEGTLQTDGYVAYDIFEKSDKIKLLACMAHARRKFKEAEKNDPKKAEHALLEIQKLYDIEREARNANLSFEQRFNLRQDKALPILEEFENWLKENLTQVLPKSAIGVAISYSLNLWKRLSAYIEDGKYEIDNNLIENSIRPVALGRKNYLFAGSHAAAAKAAMMYSFFGTCKINNVEPFSWLKDVFSRIQEHKANKLHELLPQNWKPLI